MAGIETKLVNDAPPKFARSAKIEPSFGVPSINILYKCFAPAQVATAVPGGISASPYIAAYRAIRPPIECATMLNLRLGLFSLDFSFSILLMRTRAFSTLSRRQSYGKT